MLEQLFGSKTRINLLKLFLNNPEEVFYVREITRELEVQINSVRRELKNLESLGIIFVVPSEAKAKKKRNKRGKKYYRVNTEFIFFPELKALLLKAKLMLERNFISEVKRIGKINYLVLTGIFTDIPQASTDILIVGKVNKKGLNRLIKRFEKELSHEINYTVLSKPEFKYRKDVTDRFLYNILENKKIVVVNELEKSS